MRCTIMVTFCPVSSIKRVSKVGDWTQMGDIFHLSQWRGYLWSFVKRAPDNDFNLLLNYKLSIKRVTPCTPCLTSNTAKTCSGGARVITYNCSNTWEYKKYKSAIDMVPFVFLRRRIFVLLILCIASRSWRYSCSGCKQRLRLFGHLPGK